MTYAEFQRELTAGQFRPAYYFQGDEEFLAEEGMRAVLALVLPGQEREFGLVDLGAGAQASAIKSALLGRSFFTGRRVVRLSDLGRLDGEALVVFAAVLPRVPPGTHVLMAGELDKRRSVSKELLAAVTVVNCPAVKRGEAVAKARARARTLGLELDAEAAGYLVDTVGTGLRRIATELDKALTYLGGERNVLTRSDLGLLLGRDGEDNVFQLAEAAVVGRIEEALSILTDLLLRGEPEILLLALLARQVRQVLLAGHLRDAGKRVPEIAAGLGVPVFVAEKLVRQAASFSHARCRAILERMLLADMRSKTGERDPRVELELVVLAMAGHP